MGSRGQYHKILNVTKRETFSIGGAKLLEKSHDSICMTALMVLLCNSNARGGGDLNPRTENGDFIDPVPHALAVVQGRWAGDQILVQGDYAKDTDPAFVDEETLDAFRNITPLVLTALKLDRELAKDIEKRGRWL